MVKGLKKTTLFSGSIALAGGGESSGGKTKTVDASTSSADAAKEAALEVKSREFVPGVPFSKESAAGEGVWQSLASYSKELTQTILY